MWTSAPMWTRSTWKRRNPTGTRSRPPTWHPCERSRRLPRAGLMAEPSRHFVQRRDRRVARRQLSLQLLRRKRHRSLSSVFRPPPTELQSFPRCDADVTAWLAPKSLAHNFAVAIRGGGGRRRHRDYPILSLQDTHVDNNRWAPAPYRMYLPILSSM